MDLKNIYKEIIKDIENMSPEDFIKDLEEEGAIFIDKPHNYEPELNFEESLKQMIDIRKGNLPKKTWQELKQELKKENAHE